MFNRRRKHHRHLNAVRRPRMRRLAVESMESRLLLSGNQLTGGDLDDSIYNLDTVGPNPYVVISPGDVAPPAISYNDSNPAVDVPSINVVPPANFLNPYFVTDPGYVDTGYGKGTSFLLYGASQGAGDLTSLIVNDFEPTSFFDSNLDPYARPFDNAAWLRSKELRWANANIQSSNDSVTVSGAIGRNLVTGLSSNQLELNSGFQAGFTGNTVYFAIVPEVQLPLVEPVVEANSIDTSVSAPTVVSAPTAAPLVENGFAPVAPAAKPTSDNANIAVSKIEFELEAGTGGISTITVPAAVVDVIPALRQPTREERLADAIDDLLSEDVIIAAPSGESGTEYVLSDSPTGLDATGNFNGGGQSESEFVVNAVPLADGGMIPIDAVVAVAGNDLESIAVSAAATELAASDRQAGALGELSRVAVMELIEGQPEPGAAEASDHVMVVAKSEADPLDAFRIVAHQAGAAIALATPAGPTYLASVTAVAADAASRALATLVANHLAAESTGELAATDAARHAAFSALGEAEEEAETSAALDGPHWNRWLAATPLVLAIAGERALAARKKRRAVR